MDGVTFCPTQPSTLPTQKLAGWSRPPGWHSRQLCWPNRPLGLPPNHYCFKGHWLRCQFTTVSNNSKRLLGHLEPQEWLFFPFLNADLLFPVVHLRRFRSIPTRCCRGAAEAAAPLAAETRHLRSSTWSGGGGRTETPINTIRIGRRKRKWVHE